MENKKLTCINCPEGCVLDIIVNSGKISSISGNKCKKGLSFAENEIFSPTRILTTIVAIDSEDYRRLPVRMGEIILKINNNGSQTSIIASMTIEK